MVTEAIAATTPSAAADDAAATAVAASAASSNSFARVAARDAVTTAEAGACRASRAETSTASTALPVAVPAPARQDHEGVPIAQQINEISARLDRLFVFPEAGIGKGEETPPQQRAPASTIDQIFQPVNSKGSAVSSAPRAVPPVVERDATSVDAPAGGGGLEGRESVGVEGTKTVGIPPACKETQQELPGCGCGTDATREASIAGSHAALEYKEEEEVEQVAINEPPIARAGASKSPPFGRVPVAPDRDRPAGAGRAPAPTPGEGEDITGCGRYSDVLSTRRGEHSRGVRVTSGDEGRTAGSRGGAAAVETAVAGGDDASVPAPLAPIAASEWPLRVADPTGGNARVAEVGGVLGGTEHKSDDTQLVETTAEVRGCLTEVDGAQVEAVDEPTRKTLVKTAGEFATLAPMAWGGHAPSPASLPEVAAWAGTREVVDGGKEEGFASETAPAASGGSGIKPKQVRRAAS